jgi:hypothetical protein
MGCAVDKRLTLRGSRLRGPRLRGPTVRGHRVQARTSAPGQQRAMPLCYP